MSDILYYCQIVVDLTVPMDRSEFPILPETTTPIRTITFEPSGPGTTVIAANRIGLDMTGLSYIGDDFFGEFVKSSFEKENMNTEGLIVRENYESPKVVALVDKNGQHAFVSMLDFPPIDNDIIKAEITKTKGISLTAYSMVKGDRIIPSVRFYVDETIRQGKKLFFDPGPMISKVDEEFLAHVMKNTDCYVGNTTESEIITGEKDMDKIIRKLCDMTKGIVVVKDGANGLFVASKGEEIRHYPAFEIKMVDTTGCGDTVVTGIMMGVLKNMPEKAWATLANAMGAVMAQKKGAGTQVPTFDEVVNMLESNGIPVSDSVKNEKTFENFVI